MHEAALGLFVLLRFSLKIMNRRISGPRIPGQSGWGLQVVNVWSVYSM